MPSASVERIARALLEIAAQEPSSWQGISRRERVAARQAAAVLEALREVEDVASFNGAMRVANSQQPPIKYGVRVLERLAGTPRDKEEIP